MNQQQFPTDWDEQRVKQLVAELEARTDKEWTAADEAAAADGDNLKRLLDQRVADLDANPDNVLTWEEIKSRLRDNSI